MIGLCTAHTTPLHCIPSVTEQQVSTSAFYAVATLRRNNNRGYTTTNVHVVPNRPTHCWTPYKTRRHAYFEYADIKCIKVVHNTDNVIIVKTRLQWCPTLNSRKIITTDEMKFFLFRASRPIGPSPTTRQVPKFTDEGKPLPWRLYPSVRPPQRRR